MSRSAPLPRPGHEVTLLQGSAEYFAALVAAVDGARGQVRLETYIFDFTASAAGVAEALERAARRGVEVCLVVDGLGTGALPQEWRERFEAAGVRMHVYSPLEGWAVLVPENWRRMHRKLSLVDGQVAFCGGINLLDDYHDPNHGALSAPRLDFAVRLRGPLVGEIEQTMSQLWRRLEASSNMKARNFRAALRLWRTPPAGLPAPGVMSTGPAVGEAAGHAVKAALLLRDNFMNRAGIERAYLKAIGEARREVIIANAYFVPGRKLRRALMLAARRGVQVRLLLQGRYEYFMQYYASRLVYGTLLGAGVEIHEYEASFLHAKVAVVDGHWATVGSSNLDPLSLLLAREANVVVEDEAFAASLRERLLLAMRREGRAMEAAAFAHRPLRERLLEHVALAVMRAALYIQGKRY